MNTQTLILVLILMALAILAGLVWLAILGYILAYVVLAVLVTVALIALGLSFGLIHQKMTNDRQQADFVANAKENMQLLQQQQRALNAMNQNSLVRNGHSQLPAPAGSGNFTIDHAAFDELDD